MYYVHYCWSLNLLSHLPYLYSKIALSKESINRNAHIGPRLLGIHLCFHSAWTQLSLLQPLALLSFPDKPVVCSPEVELMSQTKPHGT